MKLRYLAPLSLLTLAFACSSEDGDSGKDEGSQTGGAGGAPATGGSDAGSGGSTGDGDGEMGGAPSTGGGNGNTDKPVVSEPEDAECNLSGVWAVQAKTSTQADSLIGVQHQTANRWYLYEISQDGNAVEVVRSLNCGLQVKNKPGSSSLHITISDDGLKSIISHNSHAGLTGSYTKSGEACELDFERQYVVLGGNTAALLPSDPATRPELGDLTALPSDADKTNAEDWDGDGDLGLRFDIDAFISGTRNSVQRSFLEFDSDEGDYTIDLNSTEFTVNNQVEIEESVMTFTNDLVKTPGSLEGTAHPVTFTRLGDTRDAAKLPSGDAIPTDDFEACKALETEFPYAQ